ncbi:thiol:disulfide interchange protein [Pseudomonas gingeri NCPPB 3146 = LMG 5327]|uniref:Thiol:disulfide interchange protein n=2 Tax=Pseudomonas gingeri TaxID=117681 RepID=A0A7Y8CCP2_9PSED|nr:MULTISPECIES: thiol:disulfide interchange protein DsbA/DsbL [Pseudomonas]NVZ66910.1 thiol:disulfide interchange protein DsbA/DsbL [Pseudomonas gingeri]NVZ73927.1 thiol:disulfide interchange protein DsbA/DsbL [Pseudomonas gingeri]NWA03978.1 thiol:disulfide interchange protein DsbA/DsbL [Pseudomonas gingeri]NWA07020.1 thiol:disulfide interchange protein DsbA/DsbL [Pseudomonas gingeri]NWA15822.1 thiol:disulfide interchange protein DsbA/DsbL [Pseudomonas gingeri]
MRNLILSAALVTASLFGMTAQAADVPLKPGETYVELKNPVPISEPGKIEVVELFWYGCPHCYAFEPTINPWVEKLPADVHFVRIPAMFGGPWNAHGQLFLTLEAMGVEHKVHAAVFNAIQKEHKKLLDPAEMADFVATQGVDKDKFLATFNSFAIKGKIVQVTELAKKYEVSGVPTMIVNGKYRFDLGTAGGPEAALNVADQLIAKERAAGATAAK